MIEIFKIGMIATLQGRPYRGSRNLGMPLSGAADPLTMAIANKLAGNKFDDASIEFAIMGGEFIARHNMRIGIAGPIAQISVNNKAQDYHQSILLKADDHVVITALHEGASIYLSVHGGFYADQHWNGNSTFLPAHIGGHGGRALQSGDIIKCNIDQTEINSTFDQHMTLPTRYQMRYNDHHILRICPYNNNLGEQLCNAHWNVARQGNRIGYALDSDIHIQHMISMRKSIAVFTGHIQCPPSGKPFLLGVDAQTTGGYPIIGHVIRADRHSIGQIKSGDKISFITYKPHEARRVYMNKLKMWREYIPDLQLY